MQIFESTTIGGIHIQNRIIRSATAFSLSDKDGYVTPQIIEKYNQLANGEIGLIIFEDTSVGETTLEPKQLKICNNSYIDPLKKITSDIHHGKGKVIIQLSHSGIIQKQGAIVNVADKIIDMTLNKDDIQTIVCQFADAAQRTKVAGFDGVEIHCAHGYFLNKFLSPHYNHRLDKYGGSLDNRIRIVVEIIKSIKIKCGSSYPIFVKLNCSDFISEEQTNQLSEYKQMASILEKSGVDAIEISGGFVAHKLGPARKRIQKSEDEGYFTRYATEIAKGVSIPIIVVGGFRSIETIQSVINQGKIAAVALSRPLIREPELIKRWKNGDIKKSKCTSCNACFDPNGAICVFNKRQNKLLKLTEQWETKRLD